MQKIEIDSKVSMPTKRASVFYNSMKIICVVVGYWITSISLVFVNKYLFSGGDSKLDAPFTITWFQCGVSCVCCYLICKLGHTVFGSGSFESFNLNPQTALKILPLSFVFVFMVASNNFCLKYVPVSLYYIARSTTIIFNVIFTYLLLGEKSSISVLVCCGCIIFGFLLGVKDSSDGNVTFYGILIGILSTVFVALNAIYTKKMLPAVKNSSWQLMLYNNLNALVIFVPFVLANGELTSIFKFKNFASPKFCTFLLVSGFFGFLIGYFTVLQVKVTSPLTHNVSATAKSAFQTVLAVIIFNEKRGLTFWNSNLIVLLSSMAYSHVKHKEMSTNPKPLT